MATVLALLRESVGTQAADGQVRLSKTDKISWRNNADTGDVELTLNASDQLAVDGVQLQSGDNMVRPVSKVNGNLVSMNALGDGVNSSIPAVNVVEKIPAAIEDNIITFDAAGDIKDSGFVVKRKNLLINPNLILAQRSGQSPATFTAASPFPNNDDTYQVDKWKLLSDGNDIVDISQDTDLPTATNKGFSLKSLVATINSKWGYIQILENKDVDELQGKKVSLSFYARTTGTEISNLRAAVLSWDGTADAPTSDVVSAWNGSGVDPTLVANWTYENIPSNLALSGSWQQFKIENVDVDTAGMKNLAVFIWVDDTVTALNDTMFLANMNLNIGATVVESENRFFSLERFLCQQYAWGIFSDPVNAKWFSLGQDFGATSGEYFLPFPVPMRTNTPTGTVSAGTDFEVYGAGGGVVATTAVTPSAGSTTIYNDRIAITTAGSLTIGSASHMRLITGTDKYIFYDDDF
jgi:hypothetical protein